MFAQPPANMTATAMMVDAHRLSEPRRQFEAVDVIGPVVWLQAEISSMASIGGADAATEMRYVPQRP